MALSPAAPRRHLHTRTITCQGYARDDGLWDIEARIVDEKTYAVVEEFRGHRPVGAHVHDMSLRLTLDEAKVVKAIEVTTDDAPYDACYTVSQAYQKLVGAQVGGGWRKAVNEAVGGTRGCTHLKELLMPVATVAFQTMGRWPRSGETTVTEKLPDGAKQRPYFLDGCRAWSVEGAVVQKLYPMYYRAPKA